MKDIRWKYMEKPLAIEDIVAIENKLNVKFPQDFADRVKVYHGARTVPNCIDVCNVERVFGGLDSFDKDSMDYILLHCEYYKEHVEKGMIPFGRDPGGNNFYFDYSENNDSPKIVFWNHEEDTFEKVCNNITEFLEMLHETTWRV